MGNQRVKFEPDNFFHIYNHGNAFDNIFRCNENYRYFLQRYFDYIKPIGDTYAYCLLPNHFHFLLKIKSEKYLMEYFYRKGHKHITDKDLSIMISRQFSNFLNAYAKAFNKMYYRRGSLFLDNLRRKNVKDNEYLLKLIHYIHHNPVRHGFVESIEEWDHSSYKYFLNGGENNLMCEEVFELFGGAANFLKFHQLDPQGL